MHELYLEDDTVTIRCSEAVGVYFYTAGRRMERNRMKEDNVPIIGATFHVDKEDFMFRISVKDARGHHADTRYYYLDEICEQK